MLFAALALETLLHACAPNIGARTMTAIVRVESGGNPVAIHDNTLGRAFSPRDTNEAVAWSKQLIALNHSVDLGIAQINNANLPRLGMSIREAFDPCTNLRGGAVILGSDYREAEAQFGPGQFALRRAIGAYNSGSLFAGYSYVAKILAAAGIAAEDDFRVPDLAPIGGGAPAFPAIPARPAVAPRPVVFARPRPRPAATPAPVAATGPAPILIRVERVDAAARERAIAAAAGAAPAPAASPDAVVLHLEGEPAPSAPAVVPGY